MNAQRRDERVRYRVSVMAEAGGLALDTRALRRAIERTLRRHGCRRASVSLAVVDDSRIAAIHRRYRRRARSTDVLAFDLSAGGNGLDAEIIVSIDAARREARRRGHSVVAELALYAVHGALHLVGFDDTSPAPARRMHEEEDRILTDLGYGPVYASRDG